MNKQIFAYSTGITVPKVLDVTRINGKQALIMEYVKGKTLGNLLKENKTQMGYYLDIFIDIQQRIHGVMTNSIEPMADRLHRQIKSAHGLNDNQKYHLIQKMNSMTFESGLCHEDYHPFNLIVSDNSDRVTVIDWVDSSSGDKHADTYRTYLLCSQFSKKFADLYLRLYCKKSGLPKSDILQWAPIIAGARLSEIVSSENSDRLLDIVNQYCP